MRNPTLYPQIEKDLKQISKYLHSEDDQIFEQKWHQLKEQIHALAEYGQTLIEERRQRDKEFRS